MRRSWPAAACCLGVSVLFWLFNALEKEYTIQIQCPVMISSRPRQVRTAAELSIRVEARGSGWSLLKSNLRTQPPTIDVPWRYVSYKHTVSNRRLHQCTEKAMPKDINLCRVLTDILDTRSPNE